MKHADEHAKMGNQLYVAGERQSQLMKNYGFVLIGEITQNPRKGGLSMLVPSHL